jgi:hypothetical protein
LNWSQGIEKLTGVLSTARAEYTNEKDFTECTNGRDVMYGIVTVGHYSRFYELHEGMETLSDQAKHDGTTLHIKNNAAEIDSILCDILDDTGHSNSRVGQSSVAGSFKRPPPPVWEWDASAKVGAVSGGIWFE